MSLQFAGSLLLQSTGFPVPINLGGTGQTTDITARNALLPVQVGQSGKALVTDGVNVGWVDVENAVSAPNNQIIYGTGSSITSSSHLTYDDTTGTMVVGHGPSGISSGPGYLFNIISDVAITLMVQGTDRFTIGTNGVLSVSGSTGNNGQVLMSSGPGSAPTWQPLPSTSTITLSGDITGSGVNSINTTLATVNNNPQSNAFDKITVNNKGLITATTAVSPSDIITALGYTPGYEMIEVPVTTTTQLAVTGFLYFVTTGTATTITLPSSPQPDWQVWITIANNLTNNIVARNGSTIMGLAEDMILDMNNYPYKFRYLSGSWHMA